MLFLILAASTSVLCQTTTSSSAAQIRSMRQEIDKAFQRHDAKQLATFVSSDCHFTAPSIHIDGSDALERSHASLFMRRPDVSLAHHPNRIVVHEEWNVASEHGDWIERWTEKDGVTELRGTYLTMWKRDGGHWREYSETIVPETCTGILTAIEADMIPRALKRAALVWMVMLPLAARATATSGGPSSLQELQRLCAEEPGSQPRYFPTGVFEDPDSDQWWNCRNSRFLVAMKEAPLWPAPRNLEAYRFLWLRTFDHPIVIRVERRSKDLLLVAKEGDVEGGFEPRRLAVNEIRKVSRAQWLRLKELLQKAKSPEAQVASALDSTFGLREEWTLEGIKLEIYQVDVWPRSHFLPAAHRDLISHLLSMAGIAVASNELY